METGLHNVSDDPIVSSQAAEWGITELDNYLFIQLMKTVVPVTPVNMIEA